MLIETETLLPIEVPLSNAGSNAGGPLRAMATGVGDSTPALAEPAGALTSVRPPSPIALQAVERPNGDRTITWIRRSRAGWLWADGIDAPLGEERELYRVTLYRDGAPLRSIEVSAPQWIYPLSDRLADQAAGGALAIGVVQIGSLAASEESLLPLTDL